jgi:hypothetical protein
VGNKAALKQLNTRGRRRGREPHGDKDENEKPSEFVCVGLLAGLCLNLYLNLTL